MSALNKVKKIKVIHGKFKIYWKSLLILLMQRDLQRQKFAKGEIRSCRGMEYGTLLIIPSEATRYAVLSFQNSASCAFSKTTRILKYTTGWQTEIEMIWFKRVKRNALCSPARGALGKNPSAPGICTSTTSRGHLHLIPDVISLSLTKWNSRFPGSRVADVNLAQNARDAHRAIKTSTIRDCAKCSACSRYRGAKSTMRVKIANCGQKKNGRIRISFEKLSLWMKINFILGKKRYFFQYEYVGKCCEVKPIIYL